MNESFNVRTWSCNVLGDLPLGTWRNDLLINVIPLNELFNVVVVDKHSKLVYDFINLIESLDHKSMLSLIDSQQNIILEQVNALKDKEN